MKWKIEVYKTDRDQDPIKKFIFGLDKDHRARVINKIDLLQKYGSLLRYPDCRKIGPDLYELRVLGQVNVRLFYTFRQQTIILLHVVRKKSRKLKPQDVLIANNRKRSLLD